MRTNACANYLPSITVVDVKSKELQLEITDTPSVPIVSVVGTHIEVGITMVVVVSGRTEVSNEVVVSTSKEWLVDVPIAFKRIRRHILGAWKTLVVHTKQCLGRHRNAISHSGNAGNEQEVCRSRLGISKYDEEA